MPSLLIRCRVADYPAWKAVFDGHESTRRANGSRAEWLFRDADDPQAVVILLAWDDLERARLFADSDDLREALARSEATDWPEIRFLEDVEHRTVWGASTMEREGGIPCGSPPSSR